MDKQKIEVFLKENEKQAILKYYDELNIKLKELNKRFNKLGLTMLLLISIYYIIDKNIITNINIGPIALNDITMIKLYIPPIFAFCLFYYATLNSHYKEVGKVVRKIGHSIFKINGGENEKEYIINLLIPFSIWTEFNDKYLYKLNGRSILFLLPLLSILFIPLIFQIIIIKDLFLNYWRNGFIEKSFTIATIWIFLLTIMYYVKSIKKENSTKKANKK